MNKTKEEIIKQLETIVFGALGMASMCWSETPKGVFDSSQASNVGNEAVSLIMKLYDLQTDQIKSMEGQVKELREENEIQGNYNDMLIKELESLQKENDRLYDALSNIMNNERWLEMNIDTVNNLLSKHA